MPPTPIQVYIVDDEPSICTALSRLVRSAGMQPRAFASVEDFLSSDFADDDACVVSDIQFPGKSGFDLLAILHEAGRRLPVIFVTVHDTPEARDLAQRYGAAGYFRKPADDQALLDAIAWALAKPRPGPPMR
jgi:FixJ family two-component response regulator